MKKLSTIHEKIETRKSVKMLDGPQSRAISGQGRISKERVTFASEECSEESSKEEAAAN